MLLACSCNRSLFVADQAALFFCERLLEQQTVVRGAAGVLERQNTGSRGTGRTVGVSVPQDDDEDGDGDPANDGAEWHSHWVVLVEDSACGAGLKVRDVSPGMDLLPATAPYLPIALDSPGMSPLLHGATARITVPVSESENVSFDAVTAELQIN